MIRSHLLNMRAKDLSSTLGRLESHQKGEYLRNKTNAHYLNFAGTIYHKAYEIDTNYVP